MILFESPANDDVFKASVKVTQTYFQLFWTKRDKVIIFNFSVLLHNNQDLELYKNDPTLSIHRKANCNIQYSSKYGCSRVAGDLGLAS